MPTIAAPKKLKAEDYLEELAAQSGERWLTILIRRVLDVRTIPDKTFLDAIYNEFLISNQLKIRAADELAPTIETSARTQISSGSSYILKNLQHDNGVNALAQGATIPFHKNLTIIYGRNGSGKSGFVRILKRVSGSRTQEEIWQNVHNHATRTQNNCQAKIIYSDTQGDHSYNWTGEVRVSPFDEMGVFDGKCIPIYLNKSLGFSYQPYGFELFSALSTSLQKLQERLAADVQKEKNNEPEIDDIFDENTSIGKFVANINIATNVEDLDRLPSWNPKLQKDLKEKLKERSSLQNVEQEAELLDGRLKKIKALEHILARIQSELSASNIKLYGSLINKFNQLKKKSVAKKGKTLEDYDIPNQETDEWEAFIGAGEEYINISKLDKYPHENDQCIYCRQKLSNTTQELIKLYRELFKEEETSDLDKTEQKIDEIADDLEGTSFSENFPYEDDDFKKVLPKTVVAACLFALESADILTENIAKSLRTKKDKKLQLPKLTALVLKVQKAKEKIEADTKALEETQKNLLRKSREVEDAIKELQNVQKFLKHRPQVEKYIKIEKWLTKAIPLQSTKLNTRPITELGKKAWEELVSHSFEQRFQQESDSLKAPKVALGFRGEYGSQMREKNFEGLPQIDQFLSEGEQKAVALADFFAELSMQTEKTPVVFDDPATSFDNERKEEIAKRIVEESQARQVIVFTHDLMFISFLYAETEDPIKRETDPNKATFHKLYSEQTQVGMINTNSHPGLPKFEATINKIDGKISQLQALRGEDLLEAIRNIYTPLRGAVEKAVEEKIFGGVITRWKENIQMFNIPKATMNQDNLNAAKKLHEKFSRYIDAHSQSDELAQATTPTLDGLKADIQEVKNLVGN